MLGFIAVFMAAKLWLLWVAFREGAAWGAGCLVCFPLVGLLFLVCHPEKAWKPFVSNVVMIGLMIGWIVMTPDGWPPRRPAPQETQSLVEARSGFQTKLTRPAFPGKPAPRPPAKLFRHVKYDSAVGQLSAYVTPDPKGGEKRPAIIWITGGDCNSIDEGCWREGPPNNDQSASAFRKAGVVLMFPSLRGGNNNPGAKEGFFGEVDDVCAAANFLAGQDHVDPRRIYLGGHSTGGTLALLVAQYTDGFRAVFSFGPADDVSGYPPEFLPFNRSVPREVELRSPGRWLHSLLCPVFVFEGTSGGNVRALQAMARASTVPDAHFFPVRGADHFSVLAPLTRLLAGKVLRDTGPECGITVTEGEVNRLFAR
ncbi:MAG: prolyl oligopeptidase family serine peptidase [Gemmataceae bacterium]